jgi:hypothetical protein
MLISAAPVAIPVTTANPPTEAVASEAARKLPIPKAAPAADNPNTRNTTENHEQTKNPLDFNRALEEKSSQGGSEQKQDSSDDSSKDSSKDSRQQQEERVKQRNEQAQQLQSDKVINQLKSRDREVRAHETAHASAGGTLAGAPQLDFTTGPDGKRYAVSGEVSIDTSKVSGNAQATIDKMRQVRNAALAPANPSSQDLKVAAIASQVASQAQVELNVERNQETQTDKEDKDTSKYGGIRFANPVTAKRSSLELSQKIADSGALDDYQEKPFLSQIA